MAICQKARRKVTHPKVALVLKADEHHPAGPTSLIGSPMSGGGERNR
jgi:hypothetical protein